MKLYETISREQLVATYLIGVFGAFLQISGGVWDVSAHILNIPETFFTVQHLVLYTGVALSLLASLSGVWMRSVPSSGFEVPDRSLLTGLSLSLVGGMLQVVAGPFDFWWHSTYGFDPHLFTPSHSLLIAGIILNGVGMAVGTARLLQAGSSGLNLGTLAKPWLVRLLSVVAFASLWLVLNGLVYLITDVDGIAYTFNLSQQWVSQVRLTGFLAAGVLLAGVGALALLTARRMLPWRGSLTMALLLGAAVTILANLSFRTWVMFQRGNPDGAGSAIASFIPLYLAFLVPIIAFDLLARSELDGRLAVVAGAILGPFVSYLDGFYSLNLWTVGTSVVTISLPLARIYLIMALAAPMLLAGAVAALSKTKFVNTLVSHTLPLRVDSRFTRE